MTYIVLVRMDNGELSAIMYDDNKIMEFTSQYAADDFTDNNRLCQAYPYEIVEVTI